ncbi:MAG TPA: hypothetical protein PLH65_01060 [bacterium]|nr:hypothetical protein [bacterium]HPN67183.1 hypothetical protein [bacterium]
MPESIGIPLIFFLFVFFFLGLHKYRFEKNERKVQICGIFFQNKQILEDLGLYQTICKHIVNTYRHCHHQSKQGQQVIIKPTTHLTRFRKIIYVDFPNQVSTSRENAIIKITSMKNDKKYKILCKEIKKETTVEPIIYLLVFYSQADNQNKIDYVLEQQVTN